MPQDINWGLLVNVATLISVIGFGARVMRFINRIEFQVDMMWRDYAARTDTALAHHRKSDTGR